MRMTACYKPISFNNSSYREKKTFDYIDELCFKFKINSNKLLDIIRFTFTKKGEYTAFGFNTKTKEFWAKKIKKNKCLLYFTLTINYFDLETSNIIITPIVSDEKELSNLFTSITNILFLYQK